MSPTRDKKPTLVRASTLVAVATLASRILGLVRDMVLAAVFPKELTDIFWAAFRIPNTFRRLFGEGAVTVAFLPVFTRLRKTDGDEAGRNLLGVVLLFLLVTTGIVALLIWFGSDWVVATLLHFPVETSSRNLVNLAGSLVRTMSPYLVFVCISAVLGGALNATGRFFIPALTPVFFNSSIILAASVAFRFQNSQVQWLAYGVLLGGILQVLTQIPSSWRAGFLPSVRNPTDPVRKGVIRVLTLFLPASLSLGVFQINTLVNTYFASTVGPGAISYLFYADRLTQLPLGVFGIAISTAAFPKLSREALEESSEALRRPLVQSLKGNLLVLVPSMVGLWVLATPLVDVLFNRGRFEAQGGLVQTVPALRVYALGLIPFACVKLMGSLSFAVQDGRTPVVSGLLAVVVNLVFAYWLRTTSLRHTGIALAVVLASTANLSVLVFRLRKAVGLHWLAPILPFACRVGAASLFMGICVACWVHWVPFRSSLPIVLGGVLVGAVAYAGMTGLLLGEQLKHVLRIGLKG